jgi:hypothetical protein
MYSLLGGLREWILDLLAAIDGGDEHQERAASNDEPERPGCFVAFVVLKQ